MWQRKIEKKNVCIGVILENSSVKKKLKKDLNLIKTVRNSAFFLKLDAPSGIPL